MNRQGHEAADFFIGPEVEHTPAFSKRTLFVVGKQPLDQILRMAKEYRTPHVFMGANHSFSTEGNDSYWDSTITALLDNGLWVTLDYQAHEHNEVLKMLNPSVWQSRLFVPLLGVRIPKIQTSSANLTVKIDDIDFDATNPGVWCLHFHEVTDSNRFTGWSDYATDEVVASLAGPTATLPVKVPETASKDVMEEGLKLVATEPAVAVADVLNSQEIGLDTEPRPIHDAKVEVPTPDDAAKAYAEVSTAAPEKKGKKK